MAAPSPPSTSSESSTPIATFSDVHGIQQWGFLRLRSGAQAEETRLVIEIISTTQVRLASAFSVDQANGVSWAVRRGIKDVFVCNSLLYLTDSQGDLGQLEAGLIHFTMANVTVPGVTPAGSCIGFAHADVNGTAAFQTVRMFDCLIRNLATDVGFSLPAEFAGDNNWYGTGTNHDTGAAADGDFWMTRGDAYSDNYLAPSVVTRTHAGQAIMIPYDLNGAPRVSGSKIGAVAA